MESLQYFAPNHSGPATNQTPFAADNEEDQADDAEDHLGEADPQQNDEAPGCCRAPDALIAEENANAEFLIGLDGSPDDDAVGKLAAFRAKVQMAEEAQKRITAATVRTHQADTAGNDSSVAMESAADLAALLADHKSVCVDMRTLARSLGTDRFRQEIEESVTAAHRKSNPATLRIYTGAPLSLFDPAAWVACLVEFFYGDCAPNLERPAKIAWRQLFKYLMNREELEYHLKSDVATYGKVYVANPDSRWNTPEFAALATDAVRKLSVLQSTKAFWEKHSHNFKQDMQVLANTTEKDFQDFQLNMQKAALKNTSITGLISEARAQGATAVQKTLQHVLMHTANAPMTEGNKIVIRHMGQAMNERFGPFSAFFTTNFADTYHVLTQVLAQGAFEPLGWRPLNMLQDSPPMPTSQEMHKIVATRPMVQAKLFMHFDALTHQHLLCVRSTFLGQRKYDPCFKWIDEPAVEDDFASNGDFGLAAFLRALIKALEAQGRGFAHGHEKLHGEPRTKAIDIIQLFLGCHGTGAPEHRPAAKHIAEKTLTAWMDAHRKACLRDAATKQYDSAVESAKQFGCTELQEVFTAEEKKRCRLDGGEDEGGTQRLPNVEVVPAPEPAHVLREKRQAADEGRAMKHPYRGMPLTGAPAARFPKYLWAKHFNGYEDLDENGHATETLDFGAPEHDAGCHTGWIDHTDCYIIDGDRQVQGFRKTDGSMATEEELQAEARRYSANWSADTRFCHVFNHSHECKPTCFKNTEYKKPSADEAPKQRAACRFRFWRLVSIAERWWRRMGKALVAEPTVSAADDADNEFGRCKVRRGNCFRGSSQDLCQACLRCNVDYQYQHRTFPEREIDEQEIADGAAYQKPHQNLPGILGWLARRGSAANGKTVELLLQSFAIAARASAVADFYATKYLAKPQQWLASALGPLISGYRKKEEEQNQMEEKPSVQKMSLQKLRTAIFAANRSV